MRRNPLNENVAGDVFLRLEEFDSTAPEVDVDVVRTSSRFRTEHHYTLTPG